MKDASRDASENPVFFDTEVKVPDDPRPLRNSMKFKM